MVKTRIYFCWVNMKRRCLKEDGQDYKDYGGRGITICKEWINDFITFYKDMGDIPIGKSLDRRDNNLGYSKSNCRWATNEEQANNKRTNHFLTFKGKTQTVKQWSKELGINYFTLHKRINKHKWSVEKALNTFFKRK